MDNDWETTGFGAFLTALDGGVDILALTSGSHSSQMLPLSCTDQPVTDIVTGDTWQPQCALHAVATLEIGNLSCISVYEGASWPILNTMERISAWQTVHGAVPYQGVFASENATAEAAGADPTGGKPRINKLAFPEGFPTNKPNESTNAANRMIELVKQYPGCVSIYGAGPLTNIALAVRMEPKFATLAKQLVVMGGIVDHYLYQAAGTIQSAEIYSDASSH